MKNAAQEKKSPRLLKLVKHTIRELDPDRLSDAVGGQDQRITSLSVPVEK